MSTAKPARIEPGKKVERRLAEGETHPYLVRLEAGEYVRIAAEQRGVDLVLRLIAPGGGLIAEIDSPTGTRGAERVSEVAAITGDYRAEVVGGEGTTPGTYVVRIEEKCTATDTHRRKVEGERVFQEGEKLRNKESFKEAISYYERARTLWKQASDLQGQATALYYVGWMTENLDQWEEASRLSQQAADLYQQAGDSTGQAESLNRHGRLLVRLGRSEEARPPLEDAVRLFRESADPEGEALALNNLGNVHNWGGRFDQAADAYEEALSVWRQLKQRNKEAVGLVSLGNLYLGHGKWSEARSQFESALRIADEIKDRELSATALDSLALVDYREGRIPECREHAEHALAVYRELGNRRGQAIVLNSLGLALLRAGARDEARVRFSEARTLFAALGDAQGEAMATTHLGRVALAEGDFQQAFDFGQKALAQFEQTRDRRGISLAHYEMAQALLQLGQPDRARQQIEVSLDVAESQRGELESLNLRTFYFSTRQHYWELYIEILLELDRLHPHQGFATLALEADEGRRARGLLDALAEVQAEVRQSADPALLREEAEVQRLLGRAKKPEESEELLTRLDHVRTRMRRSSPRLARLESSKTLSLPEIRKRLLDSNTALLVYSLGETRSVLWKVTRSNLTSYPLPGREQIETAARLALDVLSYRLRPESGLRKTAVNDLAALVLGPVASDLQKFQRLLIVADGALQAVPFSALPDLGAVPVEGRQRLLVEDHEIVHLPSASVGATLRQEKKVRPVRETTPLIAVLADPVFGQADPRVDRVKESPEPGRTVTRGPLARSVRDLGIPQLERLPFSRQEAEDIGHLWRPGEVLTAFGFAANREVFEDERWRKASILHFASHSLLNDRQPELSGLVFSLVNPNGKPRTDGFLRLHEIYGLELSAELVVLSACQTGRGKELRGEGLLGLTQGFMAIGVPQLVVSLWKVEDQATAELMARFYRELYDGRRPSEALQRAQRSMLQESRWSDPALWAGFIFMGDPERTPGGGGGIQARDGGGVDPGQRADDGGLPPPRPRPRRKPPQQQGQQVPTGAKSPGGTRFSSYAPAEISPETWNTLLAYCFEESATQAVLQDSARRLGAQNDQYLNFQGSGVRPIARGSEIRIIPKMAGCRFNPPQACILWLEDWHGMQFRFQALRGLPGFALENDLPGCLSFYENSVLVADISFTARLTLSPEVELDRTGFRRTDAQPYQSVFISYSRSDSIIVETLERAYAALGVTPLRDIHFLRSGEEWAPKLLEKIEQSDIFQLFWSNRASRSKWVEAEWRHALGLRRSQFIRPMYWEDPMPRPPRELANLHFHHLQLDR